MIISEAKSLNAHKRYTGARSAEFTLDRRRVHLLLARRLRDKISSYERAAAGLESNGEIDAANALYQAAHRLKTITRRTDTNRRLH